MMATRAPLQAVSSNTDVFPVLSGLAALQRRIDALIGGHDGIDLSLAPSLNALDLVIHAKVNTDPSRLAFLLDTQPLEGVFFRSPEVRPDPKARHRKLVVAQIVASA